MELPITYEESLIGFDKIHTVNAYYQRDLNNGLNNLNTIVKSLKKLGYYEININIEEELFVKSKVTQWIKNNTCSNLINMNMQNLFSEIKNTNEYNEFEQRLNHRIERANNLNIYKNDTDVYSFYSALTLEELNCLGF